MKRFSIEARLRSFVYAGRGVVTLLGSQHNAWIHALATALVVGVGLVVGLQRLEWLALVVAIVLVWMAEAINTAFDPQTIHDPTNAEYKEFLTGRRHTWAEDRVM